jgi:hypothetical protein
MRSLAVLSGWVLRVGVGCAIVSCVRNIQSPRAHFGRYHTISFDVSREPPPGWGPSSADAQSNVEGAAASGLEKRGYLLITPSEPADLVVTIQVGRRWRIAPRSVAITRSWNPHPPDFIGVFVVDAFDRTTRELVWHGSATTDIDLARIDHEALRSEMATVLTSFPHESRP